MFIESFPSITRFASVLVRPLGRCAFLPQEAHADALYCISVRLSTFLERRPTEVLSAFVAVMTVALARPGCSASLPWHGMCWGGSEGPPRLSLAHAVCHRRTASSARVASGAGMGLQASVSESGIRRGGGAPFEPPGRVGPGTPGGGALCQPPSVSRARHLSALPSRALGARLPSRARVGRRERARAARVCALWTRELPRSRAREGRERERERERE